MSRLVTKPTKWHVCAAKTKISLGIRPVWSRVFAVRMKKACVLIYPLSAQGRLWSDWADIQADLSRRWRTVILLFSHEEAQIVCLLSGASLWPIFEPRHEKICLRGFRPGETHTGLLGFRNHLESRVRLICAFVIRIGQIHVFLWWSSHRMCQSLWLSGNCHFL